MRAVEHEVVVALERAAGGVEHSSGHRHVPPARLAHEMANVARDSRAFVDGRTVGEMDVADDADLFEQAQRAVHGRDMGFAE